MKIKIGDIWHEVETGKPIAVLLTENDKFNISNMHRDAFCYAQFTDEEVMTNEQKYEWMQSGRELLGPDMERGPETNVDPNIDKDRD